MTTGNVGPDPPVALDVPRHDGPVRASLRRRKLRAALNNGYRLHLLPGQSSPATA